ncbi:hypothetical protein ECC25_05050 [Helicobacter pylori]|nr:hypothetical protein ECC25_05050 [Helicobacter pylori]
MTYFKPLIKNFELFNALIQVSIAKGSLNLEPSMIKILKTHLQY